MHRYKARFLQAAAMVLAVSGAAQASTSIYSDNGGPVLRYVMRFEAADKPIRILGPCSSACTIALTYAGTCVGPEASLTFHRASRPELTRWLEQNYPRPIRDWIRSRGGLGETLMTLAGPELRRLVRECGE